VSWPRSLLARNAALIVALVLVGQIITFASHLVLVQLPRASQLADLTSQYLAVLEQTLAAAPRAERERIAREFSNGILRIESDPPPDGLIANPLTRIFAERIQTLMPDRRIVFTPSPNQTIWMEARVDGERMWVVTPAKGIVADNVNTWLMVSLIGVGIGLAGALLINIRINRPLDNLAKAARLVGAGVETPPLPEDGPTELATVAASFNRMVRDLDVLDRNRAMMLAGISHDLRTPLTRARIAVELLGKEPDLELVRSVVSNIDTVDRTLGQFLAFAQDETIEPARYSNVNQIVSDILEGHERAGASVSFDQGQLPKMLVRPLALGRAIENLVGNALKHGHPPFAVRTVMEGSGVSIVMRDHGPGIAPEDVGRLMQPFQQLRPDSGRSAGLGLAIAERIARLHRGGLRFERRNDGWFEVWLTINEGA
jgi:two-component system, OmpR family, osmolarity sensor histidine kinase EnvZ